MTIKTINIILLIFCVNLSFAQQTFEKLISNPEDQIINDVVEDGEGNYLLVGRVHQIENNYSSGYLIKIDSLGNLMHNGLIQETDTSSCQFFNIHYYNNNIYVLGSKWINYPNISKLWYIKLNSTLEIVDEKLFNVPTGKWFSYMNSIIDSDNNLVLAGYTGRIDNQQEYHIDPAFYKISLNGDSISSNFMSEAQVHRLAFDIIENPDNTAYYAFVSRFDNSSVGDKVILNRNLDSINIQPIPLGIFDNYSPIYLTDSSILLCGNGSPYESELYALNVISINDQTELIDYNYFKINDNMRDHPAVYNGVSKNGDNIYIGGTSNFDYNNPFYSSMDSWFHLIKINPDITPIWEYWYGGDAYYQLYSILATSDGGCLMVGNRYDDEIQNGERDIYIVKVNSDGLIVWTQEIEINNDPSVVYPNPGTNSLQVKTYQKEWLVELFNLNGQLMIKQQVNADENTIDTQMLKPGMYFYRLTDLKNKTLDSGKWVKQ
jgi:hypothetical protein